MCVLSGNGCRWEMQKREGGDCVSACVWMCHWWLWALCVARVHLLVCVSKSGCGWKRWCDYKWEKQKPGREDEVKEKEILSFTRRRTDIIQADGQNNRTTSCWTVNTNLVKLPEVKTLGPFNKAAVFYCLLCKYLVMSPTVSVGDHCPSLLIHFLPVFDMLYCMLSWFATHFLLLQNCVVFTEQIPKQFLELLSGILYLYKLIMKNKTAISHKSWQMQLCI